MVLLAVILTLFSICGLNSFSINTNPNPRSLNVNLETTFKAENGLFHNSSFKDKLLHFIEILNQWLDKLLKRNVDDNDNEDGDEHLSAYVKKIGNIILKYEDENIKHVTTVIADEVHEIVNNNEDFSDDSLIKKVKYYLGNIKNMDPQQVKMKLRKIIKKGRKKVRAVLKNINKFYNKRDFAKLKEITVKFEKLPRVQRKIKRIAREVFDVLFYEKYDSLDKTTKLLFVKEIKKLLLASDFETRRVLSDGLSRVQSSDELEINATITI